MPTEAGSSDVTRLLEAARQGDPQAARDLLPIVYDELRRLAAQSWRERNLGRPSRPPPSSTRRICAWWPANPSRHGTAAATSSAAAAEAMRRILVENAHGISIATVMAAAWPASTWTRSTSPRTTRPDELLAINEALDRLVDLEPTVAEVVKLRYFAGLTIEETASALGISVRTANRHWAYARAWLLSTVKRR